MADWLVEHVRKLRIPPEFDFTKDPPSWEGKSPAERIYGPRMSNLSASDSQASGAQEGNPAEIAPADDPSRQSGDWAQNPGNEAKPEATPDAGKKTIPTDPEPPRQKAFNVDKAAAAADRNSLNDPSGYCARFVRKALQEGGAKLPEPHPVDAKDYGPHLEAAGMSKADKVEYTPEKGDVAVIQPYEKGKSGHIQMYDGTTWVSDYKQNPGWFYPGDAYRKKMPSYEIYRP